MCDTDCACHTLGVSGLVVSRITVSRVTLYKDVSHIIKYNVTHCNVKHRLHMSRITVSRVTFYRVVSHIILPRKYRARIRET